jgi:DNA-binding MarR family transcriptional regulator
MLSLEDQIVIALRRISQAIDVWSRRLWQDYGLTSPQLATLRELLAGKNVSPMTLAAALHLSQPTVTGILGRLEQRDLIRRARSSTDRRSVVVSVTEEGRRLAAKAPPLLRDQFRHELAKLPHRQQSEILRVLQSVATMMQAPDVANSPYFFHERQPAVQRSKRHLVPSTATTHNRRTSSAAEPLKRGATHAQKRTRKLR